jgi:CRISPR-associated endoribonuclease Cas6
MRIQITLRDKKRISYLPINTNYYLADLLSKLTKNYESLLKSILPTNGCNHEKFNFYTFSQLIIPNRKIEKSKIAIYSAELYWYVSSPFPLYLEILAKELLRRKWVNIADNRYETRSIKFLHTPSFNGEEVHFTCLSPVTILRNGDTNLRGKLTLESFLFPEHKEFKIKLIDDIKLKYRLLKGRDLDDILFEFTIDSHYLRKRNNKISKLIAIEKNKETPDYIRGFLAPFKVKTAPEILRLIYDAGLGQFNPLGFGMIATIPARNNNIKKKNHH